MVRLPKEEVLHRWEEVWHMVSKIITHLQKSPIFYAGSEFTEESYKSFLGDEKTNVFVATDKGKYVGMIETNPDKGDFVIQHLKAVNVGEIYVEKAYRGTSMSHNLLMFVGQYEQEKGNNRLWVEHGTANPNAIGFWNKYFMTYCYGMCRDIVCNF